MSKVESGVYPVHQNKFKIGIKGAASTQPTDMKTIKDLETFSLSMDNNIEEWSALDQEGWTRRMSTGKGFSISLSGKSFFNLWLQLGHLFSTPVTKLLDFVKTST